MAKVNKIPLKEGKMKTAELAQFFGITAQSFRNNKEDKMKELKDYAEFEEIYGGVNIKKILVPGLYEKKVTSKARALIKDVFMQEWNPSGIDTCKNVSRKIYTKYKDELAVVESTAYGYTIIARNEDFGRPFMHGGALGECKYLWCKQEQLNDGTVILTEFTEEEQQIKKRLMKKYFASDEEKDILIREMVDAGEITKEEAYDLSCEYRGLNKAGFISFKMELEEAIGASVTKGTILIVNNDKNKIEFLPCGDGE